MTTSNMSATTSNPQPTAKRKNEDLPERFNNPYLNQVLYELKSCRSGEEAKVVMLVLQPSLHLLANRFNKVKSDLEYALSKIFFNFELVTFGSVVSGLAFQNSDMDFHVRLPRNNAMPVSTYILQLQQAMKRLGHFNHTEAVIGAKVPILRVVHYNTNIACDINFTCPQGYYNSCLIHFFMNLDERIHQVAVIIKYWITLNRHLVEQKKLNNYCIINMLIFYLQQLRYSIIPDIALLQFRVPPVRHGPWNYAFNKSFVTTRQNRMSTFELLEGFFRFYAKFDYGRYVICPLYARLFERSYFNSNFNQNPRIYQEFSAYVFAVEHMGSPRLQVHTPICVQDPFELNNNVGKACLRQTLTRWIALNKLAVQVCEENVGCSRATFLTTLFTRSLGVDTNGNADGAAASKRARHN